MKTEEEIRKADKREREIQAEKEVADKAARVEYHEVTKEEFAEYERVWKPAQEKWEEFTQPHCERLQARLIANKTAELEALAEVRSNWTTCPRCGTPAARYQIHCSKEKCEMNLVTGQRS